MSPQQEAKLKFELGIALGSAAMFARMFTQKDPALGMVIQQGAMDVTGIHWDRYKTMYEALKGGTMKTTGIITELDAETVEKVLAALGQM